MSEPLSVTLEMPAETAEVLRQDEASLEAARELVIDSPAMANIANDELRGVKARIKRLKELKEGFVAPARQILDNAAALFNPALNALTQAESVIKGALGTWQTEQERIAAEARRLAQEAERKRIQEAEAVAAAARAKAQEQAREQERIAAEAERKRLAAIAEGNAREASRQAALAAKATETASAVVQNAEVKAMDTIVAAQVAAPAPVAVAAKVAGFSMRDNYKAELLPSTTAQQALREIVALAATTRPDLLSILTIDMAAADRLAKAQKSLFNCPGLQAVNRPVATSRAA